MAKRIWKPPNMSTFSSPPLEFLQMNLPLGRQNLCYNKTDPKKLVYVVFFRKYMQFLDHHTAGALLHPTVHATGDFLLAPDKKPLTDHSSDIVLTIVS